MSQVVSILFAAAFTAAVCFALGKLLLQRLSIALHREEEIPLAFVTGAACLSLMVFLLCAARLAYDGVFLGLGVLALVIAERNGALALARERLPALPRAWRWLFRAVYTIFAVLYFCYAMAPEMSPDGSTYHLGLVDRYHRAHGFERITTNMYANLSQGVEMLYLFAYTFGRHSAAAMVHFLFLASLPLAMLSYARRFGFPVAGVAGALFFFASPVVGIDGSTAYNDVATAGVLFGLFYFLRLFAETRQAGLLAPVGLLAGFGYAAKYTAALGVPFALGWVAWMLRGEPRRLFHAFLVTVLCAFAMMAPWMAKNWIWLDNPFSPFFNRLFPNPYVHVSFEKTYSEMMRNYPGLTSRWEIPLEVTVRGTVLCGLLGPLFLLAPLALGGLKHREGGRLLLAALVFGITYAANIGTRFLIPPLPYLSLAMALTVSRIPALAAGLIIVHAVLSWPSVIPSYSDPASWRIDRIRIKQALRIESEEGFLRRLMPEYSVARMIQENVPPGEKVLTFSGVPEAYTTREILVVYQSAFNEVLGDLLWTPINPGAQPSRRLVASFPEAAWRKIRVVQTASGPPGDWSIAELRLCRRGKELTRAPEWRLRAHPNPWDVQRAFDNSPVTRWRSWEALFDGMFVEVDLGAEQIIDSVVIECSPDQPQIRLRLDGMRQGSAWEAIPARFENSIRPLPVGLRRMATSELKRAGVRYLLVDEKDFGREDFQQRRRAWGITALGEAHGRRLYRID